jgi:hypothetical protein
MVDSVVVAALTASAAKSPTSIGSADEPNHPGHNPNGLGGGDAIDDLPFWPTIPGPLTRASSRRYIRKDVNQLTALNVYKQFDIALRRTNGW